jgi:hypothetical protein
MEDVLKLTLGFAFGTVLSHFLMAGYVALRYKLHDHKHPRKESQDIEELLASFRKAYVKEDEDGEPTPE